VAAVDSLNRHCQIVTRRLGNGSVVPFLGAGVNLCERPMDADWEAGYPPSGAELAAFLAAPYGYPEADLDLLRVAQWVDLVSSPRALVDELHAVFSRDYRPNKLHRFLAELPHRLREEGQRVCGQLVLTTNYDDVLERAFAETGEPVDVVIYETRGNEQRFVHLRTDGERVTIDDPARYREFALERQSVILKIHGDVDRDDSDRDTFVVTEDHYIDYLARERVRALIPAYLMRRIRESDLSLPRLLDAGLEPAGHPPPDLGGAGGQHGRLVDPARTERGRPEVLGAAADRDPRRPARGLGRRHARAALVSVPAAPAAAADVRARRSPYQGLVPYSEGDAEWFFGRDEWSEVLADNFRAYRVTVLYGVSGVGKSSLLRAGLIRRLGDEARANVADLGYPRLLPVGFSAWSLDAPVAALKEAVREAAERPDLTGHSPEGALADVLGAWPALAGGQLLLVLDQLEELFAYHERPHDPVLEELAAALRRANPAVHFLLSIREDAMASLDRFEGHVSGLGEHVLRLEHLDRDAAREAIVQPLQRWNRTVAGPGEDVEIEPSLIEAVLEQVTAGKVTLGDNGSAALNERAGVEAPYLQLVLTRLWDEERRNGSRLLRLHTLERLGGADRIVRTHLDTALAALPLPDQDLAGRTFRYLVTPSGTKIAHRISDLADYAQAPPEQIEHVIDLLAGEVRVLRPAGDGRYEIYHDALAGPIVDWRRRWEERQKRRRERRRLALLAGVAAVLAGIAVAVAILAVFAWHARHDARVGQSGALAGQAVSSVDEDAPRALRLAVRAAEAAPTSRAEDALRVTLANFLLSKTLRGHDGAVRSAAFSRDGRLVVTGSDDGTARIWDTASGRTLRTLRGHEGPVTSAAFSPSGTLVVTGGYDGTARLWNAEDGTLRKALTGHKLPVFDVAFNSRGDRLVTAGYDGTARIWDTATGRLVHILEAKDGPVFSAAFSPDGTLLATASGYDGNAHLWHADTGSRVPLTLGGHRGNIEKVVFSPDGRFIVTAGSDGTARIWDHSGSLAHILLGHEGAVFGAAISPDDTLVVTAGTDGTARLWDARSGRLVRILGSGGTVFAAAFSPDGDLVVTADDDGTARLWDLDGESSVHTLDAHGGAVRSAAFSPDGRSVVTAGDEGTAAIWDAERGRRLHVLGARVGPVRSAAFSPDGKSVVTAGDDGKARIWDVDGGSLRHVLSGHGRPINTAAFSPDSTLVVTAGDDRTARVWDVRNGRLLHTLGPHYGEVLSAAFSPDGKSVVTAGRDGTARLWDTQTGRLLRSLGTPATLRRATFSPDGTLVAAASDVDAAWLWNAADGRRLHTLSGHAGVVWTVAFSPDGARLVTSSDDELARVWDTANGRRLQTLSGHEGPVRSAVFSPDGKLVLTAGDDSTARLWDTDSGRALRTLSGDTDAVYGAAFSPDGKLIVTASQDGTARIWTCDFCGMGVRELLARAKARLASSS
jgi:WD40 repeat protein